MTDQTELRRIAKRVQGEIARHGVVTVYLVDQGEPRAIPGYGPRLVGVYEQWTGMAQLADDLQAARGDGP